MSDLDPVGIFDSGIGGLSVYSQVRKLLPAENLIYIADNAYLPYGDKSQALVKKRSFCMVERLLKLGAKAIVVACNTATAAAISSLRDQLDLPIVGMEPGLKPGVENSHNGKVAILATEGTLGSVKFQALVERHANDSDVLVQPCHGWVELVEEQRSHTLAGHQMISRQLMPLLKQGVDTLVLGCTHYPFLKDAIIKVAGAKIQIIDTSQAVAKQLERRLLEEQLLSGESRPGTEVFYGSALSDSTDALFSALLGRACRVKSLPDPE